MKKAIILLFVILPLLLAACDSDSPVESIPIGDTSGTAEDTNPVVYTVTFMLDDAVYAEQSVTAGALPEALNVEIAGLRVIGWCNDLGENVDPFDAPVNTNICYRAQYYPVLDTHVPYLFLNEEGLLQPDEALTADALQQALTALAAEGATEYFPTLPKGSEALTPAQVQEVLGAFFEADRINTVMPTEESDVLSRSAFASMMHQLLERPEDETVVLPEDALIPVDLTEDRADALILLEAVMSHTVDEAGQLWSAMELPVPYEPGFVNIEGYLYYVQENHYFLKDGDLGVLHFGSDGRYTCGDTDLDDTVAGILKEMIAAEPEADRMTLLRRVFDYCHTTFKYGNRYSASQLPHPEYGATGFEIERAKIMFDRLWGNCYYFSSAFWALSRGLGFETRAVSGTCLSDRQPHSWTFIPIDGVDYIFDPEWQWAYHNRGVYDKDMFMIPSDKWSNWGYRWQD